MAKKIILAVILILAVFLRTVNLTTHSHFLADEARDLNRIHQIFVDRKLTVVGPIADDQSHVYSSLTYYLLMPFAAIFNFQPIGTVVGAAFYGILTVIILVWLIFRLNPQSLIWAALLAAVWWPLVSTSRWPWNPNFVTLWLSLALLFGTFKGWIFRFLSGIASGFSLHHHLLAFPEVVFIWLKKRTLLTIAGIVFTLLPLIYFDLTRPPGLFFTGYLRSGSIWLKYHWWQLVLNYLHSFPYALNYFVSLPLLRIPLVLIVLLLVFFDLKNKSPARYWLAAIILSLGIFAVYPQQIHYLLPLIPLIFMWIFSRRRGLPHKVSLLLAGILCLAAFPQILALFGPSDFNSDLRIITGAVNIIHREITRNNLDSVNLAVLKSPEEDRFGRRYRELLQAGGITVNDQQNYLNSKNLFVITTGTISNLQGDGAAEIDRFRNGPVLGEWEIPDTGWRVVEFGLK